MEKLIVLLILSVQLFSRVFGADKKETIMEGDSVSLIPDPDEIHGFFEISWLFGDPGDIIAEFDRKNISYANKTFKDRLELNNQNGSLTIRNMRISHSGRYKLQIEKQSGVTYLTFTVTVYESPNIIDPNEAEMTSVSVTDGDSVTLQTDVSELHGDALIVWRFGTKGKLIAKQDRETKTPPSYDPDERFRGRLKLDQTGSLTIRNIKVTDFGVYTVKISSNKQTFHRKFSVHLNGGEFFNIQLSDLNSGSPSTQLALCSVGVLIAAGVCLGLFYRFCWRVKKERKSLTEGGSVTLRTGRTRIQKDDEIKWRYGAEEDLIAGVKCETYPGADERFFGKLKMDANTADLTISNVTTVHSGLYKLKIESSYPWKNIIRSTFRAKYQKKCIVTVKVEEVLKNEGNTVILKYPGTLKAEDVAVLWRFGPNFSLIAKLDRETNNISTYDGPDGRFRDRLKLDDQTGSLTIADIRAEHTGVYEVKILNSEETRLWKYKVVFPEDRVNVSETVVMLPHDGEEYEGRNSV